MPLSLRALLVLGALAACDANPSTQPLGSMDITSTTPTTTFTTIDGWAVKVDRFLVHVSSVTVAGSDGVVAASSTAQIVDEAVPGPKSLLSATVRTARPWQEVSFEIGPAATGSVAVVPPVTEADRDQMAVAGLSMVLEGKATKGDVTKLIKWGFKSDTRFLECAGELDGTFLRGLSVPQDGNDTADVVLNPSAFFRDDLDPARAVLRFEAIATADANADGAVSLEELREVPLESAAAVGGGFAPSVVNVSPTLGSHIEALSRQVVASFRAKGACTPEVVGAAEVPEGASAPAP